MIYDKCKKDVKIQEHHLLPKFMDNPHGYSYSGYPSRIDLCSECHVGETGIHQTVIFSILLEFAPEQIEYDRYAESDIWKVLSNSQKEIVKERTVKESWRWINANS